MERAFIQNNGNFLFKADNDNLVSFGTSVSGGEMDNRLLPPKKNLSVRILPEEPPNISIDLCLQNKN